MTLKFIKILIAVVLIVLVLAMTLSIWAPERLDALADLMSDVLALLGALVTVLSQYALPGLPTARRSGRRARSRIGRRSAIWRDILAALIGALVRLMPGSRRPPPR